MTPDREGVGEDRPAADKPQVLFVDDEPNALAALRRSLGARAAAWDLRWVVGATEALHYLERHRVDVLVTDMRMPGMDGAELLDRVRRLYPSTARVVLSGQADQEAVIAAAGASQQFLPKPCDPDRLVAALHSAITVRALMADEVLQDIIGGTESLPKPPQIYVELTALAARPGCTMSDVAHLIERDVSTATELLKLVNSSFFGLAYDVTTVERAVSLLGLEVIKALVLAGRVFRPAAALPPGLSATDLARRGAQSCTSMRVIAVTEGWSAGLTGQLCLAALLQDVGLLVLAANNPHGWEHYRQGAASPSERELEVDAFGCTIGQASAYLLGLWGFHPTVVAALAEQPLNLNDAVERLQASPAALAVAETRCPTPFLAAQVASD